MERIDAPSNTRDITELKIPAALLLSLLGKYKTMKYEDDTGRVVKTVYRLFLERIQSSIGAMIANHSKVQIIYNNPITRVRIADKLINNDKPRAIITMPEYTGMMRAQQAHLLRAVKIVRG